MVLRDEEYIVVHEYHKMRRGQEKLTLYIPRPRLAALCAYQMSSVRLLVASASENPKV